ncbi:MAG: hypothetical protein JWQ11_309 [Rhizobacter sp.]|nr:hypothetical protein [Rhizobacter sp.]
MNSWTRRRALASALSMSALACAGMRPRSAGAHESAGIVAPPKPAPSIEMSAIDTSSARGTPARLDLSLRQRVTAVQLMFTGCSATCPIQGALFADLQQALSSAPADFRMLSISIDPLGDDAKAMAAWMRKFGASPARWTSAVPAMSAVDPLFDFLNGRAPGIDRHTPQVYVFDAQARLRYRTADMPPAPMVASLMREIAKTP